MSRARSRVRSGEAFPDLTAILVLAGIGFLFRDYFSGSVTDLKVGDCFDAPSATTAVKDVQHHPCTDAHLAEVFFVGNMTGTADSYPGTPGFTRFAEGSCVGAFRTYTGRDFEADTVYDISFLRPTTDGWAKGDRGVTCYVVRVDGKPITGTLKTAR